jgi:hypothetical protein
VAQLLVQALRASIATAAAPVSAQQRVNAYLLTHRFMDATAGELWGSLQQQKVAIAAAWQPLQRFYLEVGDDYALLLDANRRQLSSRQYFLALKVAQSLGVGLPQDQLGRRIKLLARQLYPQAAINQTQVKEALVDNGLARLENGSWLATPVAKRFAITLEEDAHGE